MSTFANSWLADGQVSNVQASIFTASALTLLKSIKLGNPVVSTQTILLWRQHGAGTARFWRRIQLAQYESAEVIEGASSIELDIGDSILAQSSDPTSTDYIIDGVVIT